MTLQLVRKGFSIRTARQLAQAHSTKRRKTVTMRTTGYPANIQTKYQPVDLQAGRS